VTTPETGPELSPDEQRIVQSDSASAALKAADAWACMPAGPDFERKTLAAVWPLRRAAFIAGYEQALRDAVKVQAAPIKQVAYEVKPQTVETLTPTERQYLVGLAEDSREAFSEEVAKLLRIHDALWALLKEREASLAWREQGHDPAVLKRTREERG
jgi:hypothetical protein